MIMHFLHLVKCPSNVSYKPPALILQKKIFANIRLSKLNRDTNKLLFNNARNGF